MVDQSARSAYACAAAGCACASPDRGAFLVHPRTTGAVAITHWARAVCAGMRATGCRHVVYVPDNPLSHVLRTLREQTDVRTTLATREEEAFGIAAGIYLGGGRPAVMLQSSGLGNSLNALTSLLLPYQIPVLILISMRGDAAEWNAAQVPMGRAVTHVLDAIGVPHVTVDACETAAEIVERAGRTAFATRLPGACMLPRRLTVAEPVSDTR